MVSATVPQLPRVDRISDRSTFARLRLDAVRARSGPLGFRYIALPETDGLGVGYAIARTVGPAVVRNRLRRRLRAICQELAPSRSSGGHRFDSAPFDSARYDSARYDSAHYDIAPGAMLIIVRPAAARLNFADLTAVTHAGLGELAARSAALSPSTAPSGSPVRSEPQR